LKVTHRRLASEIRKQCGQGEGPLDLNLFYDFKTFKFKLLKKNEYNFDPSLNLRQTISVGRDQDDEIYLLMEPAKLFHSLGPAVYYGISYRTFGNSVSETERFEAKNILKKAKEFFCG